MCRGQFCIMLVTLVLDESTLFLMYEIPNWFHFDSLWHYLVSEILVSKSNMMPSTSHYLVTGPSMLFQLLFASLGLLTSRAESIFSPQTFLVCIVFIWLVCLFVCCLTNHHQRVVERKKKESLCASFSIHSRNHSTYAHFFISFYCFWSRLHLALVSGDCRCV